MIEKKLEDVEKKIGVDFSNKDLLLQAFIHRSYLNEHSGFRLDHNERLEFLGDAVLELVVTDYLYKNYPNPEGELTNWRAALVRGEMLSRIAQNLGFNDYLYLSKGESKELGKARSLILANAFEAVIGAIYLDSGLNSAKEFITKNIIKELPKIIEEGLFIDYKTRFQEFIQGKHKITPRYEILEEEGPEHDKKFKVGVYMDDKLIGLGSGRSKQTAEEKAAEVAFKKMSLR